LHVSGQHSLSAPPTEVWDALHDVRLLRAAVPGCDDLEQTGPGQYSGSARVGIAVIKRLYRGSVKLGAEVPPHSICIAVDARSGHARISGEGALSLEPAGAGTLVRYTGDVHIHGPLASVGQRLLPSASKSLTEQFFRNLERALNEDKEPSRGGDQVVHS
jgi:carbon monoxide dehydrogenase subunit G